MQVKGGELLKRESLVSDECDMDLSLDDRLLTEDLHY